MAGGGVGEAMLIGAAVGAGTGGIMSAAQDKDPLEGALLGAAMGAAGGGIGSAAGGALSGAATGASTGAATGTAGGVAGGVEGGVAGGTAGGTTGGIAGGEVGGTVGGTAGAGTGVGSGLSTGGADILATGGVQGATTGATTTGAGASPAAWGQQGIGQGFAPTLTNAQAYGAGVGGGLMGLVGQSSQNQNNMAPEPEPYTGSLSYFKYNPQTFRPNVAPGYADGGITMLSQPSKYIDRVDYDASDAEPNGYAAGGITRLAGGGIGFVRALQPGGEFGAASADIYGAQQELKPSWLTKIEPGGFVGATVPGKMDYEDKKRAEAETAAAEQAAIDEAEKKRRRMASFVASQYGMSEPNASIGMARGGISDLGSYSDGGRMLRGPGDGMSDDIPGVIAGKQPARLADGEFVVPADVVSHLGNGSTDAGAKKLYSMMDSVRKARTGSKKQGRQIKADKYVPGMARGGRVEDGIMKLAGGGEWTDPYLVPTTQGGFLDVGNTNGVSADQVQAMIDATRKTTALGVGATSSTGFKPTGYDPNYYNPQYYQSQLTPAQQFIDQYQPLKPIYGDYLGGEGSTISGTPGTQVAYGANGRYSYGTIGDSGQLQLSNAVFGDPIVGTYKHGYVYNPSGATQEQINEAEKQLQQNKDIAQAAQQNLSRLEQSGIRYDPYTLSGRPSSSEPQFYGNIYQPEYVDYARPGYNMNAQLGAWNNEYGSDGMPTQRQQNIAQLAQDQRLAQAEQLANSQLAAQTSRQLINASVAAGENKPPQEEKKRKGGIASLV